MTSPTAKICRDLGAKVLVDGNAAARIGFDAGSSQVQLVNIALPANGIEQGVAGDALLAFEIGDDGAVRQLFNALHLFGQTHGHAAVAQVVAERFHDFLVGKLQQLGPLSPSVSRARRARRTCRCIRRR